MSKLSKSVKVLIMFVVFLAVVVTIGAYLNSFGFFKSLNESSQPPQDGTSSRQAYWNENSGLKFQYPGSWEVLVNNPNNPTKIDLSIRGKKYSQSFEWPGLSISDNVPEFVGFHEKKFFSIEDENDGVIRIGFIENGRRLYASCSLYLDRSVLDECNRIISTVQIEQSFDRLMMSYQDSSLGISFDYPRDWGKIVQQIEENPICGRVSCRHTALHLEEFAPGTIIFATYGKDFHGLGRGGYWGDAAGDIKSEEDVRKVCEGLPKEICSVYRTKSGFMIARLRKWIAMGEGEPFLTYYLYPNHPDLFGIIFSTDRLVLTGLKGYEKDMDVVVESFQVE